MDEERLTERREDKSAPHPGFELASWLRIGGCAIVLVVTVLCLVLMFTAGRDPVAGYKAPESREYYAGHLTELEAELADNLFPHIEGIESWRVAGDTIEVALTEDGYAAARSAILRYYDASLFTFIYPNE